MNGTKKKIETGQALVEEKVINRNMKGGKKRGGGGGGGGATEAIKLFWLYRASASVASVCKREVLVAFARGC